jgi:hypothetical protein
MLRMVEYRVTVKEVSFTRSATFVATSPVEALQAYGWISQDATMVTVELLP